MAALAADASGGRPHRRDALLAAAGWDVETDGLAGAPVPTVLLGDEAHATMVQALRLLGFGAGRAIRVRSDEQGRMLADDLAARLATIDGPVLVCAQVGQVNTGASDPFDAIADLLDARRAGGQQAWWHVDGAFGLWAAAASKRRHLVAGVERADSWGTDAHTWLNVPYDAAMAIVSDPAPMTSAMSVSAGYLTIGDALDGAARTPENSRRARATPIWAALRSLGRHGVADLVERCCRLATRAAERLAEHPRVEILNDVELNQVLIRVPGLDPSDLAREIARDGLCWIGTTVWHGEPALRLSVSNWSTTADDIDASVDRIRTVIDGMTKS